MAILANFEKMVDQPLVQLSPELNTHKPIVIYCLERFSIVDYKLWSLIIRDPLKISFSFLEYIMYVWMPNC